MAGNNWLRDKAIEYGARAVTVEVAEDTQRIQMHLQHENTHPITIGWLGSKSTVKYLNIIAPALRRVASEYDELIFEIVGGGDFQMEGVPWEISEWSLDGELEALSRFDIGLMPLPEENWSKGKSGGKARTYMAAGVVAVCTGYGYNLELINNKDTGFLCNSNHDWYYTISTLIENPKLRQSIADKARSNVEARFSLEKQARILRDLFDDIICEKIESNGQQAD